MSRRYDKTLADYLVIAVSPALIMTLIGGLVFFLLEVFYRGNYVARLHYILTWFIIAAVLIARIAVEEGSERAALFALPLAGATLLTINRYVEYHGAMPESMSLFINIGLIGLIWWCAHKLTWDCTMIDEMAPSSGEGLFDATGLGKQNDADEKGETADGGSSRVEIADPQPPGRWNFFRDARSKPHSPGVWVVYFSIAALPIFGIGQLFIPAANIGQRRYAFCLLAVYVASALGLLLTTSFLGLRRYLRQRRLPMPLFIANTWIALGCALIFAVMLVALFVPRPNAEYAMSQIPPVMGSPDQKASEHGHGREGAKGKQRNHLTKIAPNAKKTVNGKKDSKPDGSKSDKQSGDKQESNKQGGDKQEGDKQGGDKKGGDKPSGDSQSGGGKQSDDKSSDSKPSGDKQTGDKQSGDAHNSDKPKSPSPPDEKASKQSDGQRSDKPGEQPSDKPGGDAASKLKPNEKPSNEKSSDEKSNKSKESSKSDKPESNSQPEQSQENGDQQSADKDQADENQADDNPSSTTPPDPTSALAWLLPVVQWLFYAAVIGFGLYWAWRHRVQLMAAMRNLLAGLSSFWESLFGRRKQTKETIAEAGARKIVQPFALYADPFATGMTARLTAEQLVRYTFDALEAWARENGCTRELDQTPHEFARNAGGRAAPLRQPAMQLANLYCEAVYAPGRMRSLNTQPLEELWQAMRAGASEPVGQSSDIR